MNLPARQRTWRSLPALLFLSLATATVSAQTFTTLYNFAKVGYNSLGTTNSDGATPYGGVILSGTTLYGTTDEGGISGRGTVFAVSTNGTGFTVLYTFTALSGSFPGTNIDGAGSYDGLILSGNTLYGTTSGGGSFGNGTAFAVNSDGTGFTNLHTFAATLPFPGPYTNSEGAVPHAGLILSGSTLYGTTSRGGSSGYGILFAVNTDGTGFTNLHTFVATDGAGPRDLILSSNTLYGTTASGGSLGGGVAFAVNIDGNGFTNLHSFTTISAPYYTNSDGHFPSPRLVLSGDTLYGTTHLGGSFANGAIFSVHTDGTGFTNLHNFTVTVSGINYDGIKPLTGLIISGDTLYGTTEEGGRNGVNGTVFAVNTDGSGFTNLHSFSPTFGAFGTNSDGAKPRGELILSGNTLYGTTQYGGVFGSGTIFSISLPPPPPPQLTIIRSAENIVLSWPTNSTGFTLQSTTNLPSTNWSPVPDAPAIVGNRFYVTNSPAGSALFYRLRGN